MYKVIFFGLIIKGPPSQGYLHFLYEYVLNMTIRLGYHIVYQAPCWDEEGNIFPKNGYQIPSPIDQIGFKKSVYTRLDPSECIEEMGGGMLSTCYQPEKNQKKNTKTRLYTMDVR